MSIDIDCCRYIGNESYGGLIASRSVAGECLVVDGVRLTRLMSTSLGSSVPLILSYERKKKYSIQKS